MSSRLVPEFDLFVGEGKRTGFIRIPHSVHRSAYGFIPLPVATIANGPGPVVLLTAGNHGDEYEGQVALGRLIRELDPGEVRGRLVILPSLNFPAAMAGTRTSPIDQGNLNRSFPGDANGTVTQQIAWFVENVLMARATHAFDFHSGGSSLMYVPAALGRRYDDPAKLAQVVALVRAFGAPIAYLSRAAQGADQTLTAGADRRGLVYMGTELGGGGQVTPAALRACEAGIRRILHLVGALAAPPPEPAPPTRLLEVRGAADYVYAPEDGVFEPLVELGDTVAAGQPAGLIHFTDTPWREPALARFEAAGLVICKRVPGMTQRGDCLFHLGADLAV
ncbi:MAG: succinylglutamate desuccinylase/aspartoacylase family protein [Thalassobaculales bacterium]